VTTDAFLAAFGLTSLADLPDPEQLQDAGLAQAPLDQLDPGDEAQLG